LDHLQRFRLLFLVIAFDNFPRLTMNKTFGSLQTNRKRDKRRSQRYRAAPGSNGIERASGVSVQIRDFSSESLAIESPTQASVRKPIELDFPMGDHTFVLRGAVVRSERVPSVGCGPTYLTVVQLGWSSTSDRLQLAGFLATIRKSTRSN
jgi:hypothetical protein